MRSYVAEVRERDGAVVVVFIALGTALTFGVLWGLLELAAKVAAP